MTFLSYAEDISAAELSLQEAIYADQVLALGNALIYDFSGVHCSTMALSRGWKGGPSFK